MISQCSGALKESLAYMNNKNGIVVQLFFFTIILLLAGCFKKPASNTFAHKPENRSINGRLMARRIQKRVEDELIPRMIDKGYVADEVQKIAHNELGGKSFHEIKDALIEAHCLKIPHVVNALAELLVSTNSKQVQQIIRDQSDLIPLAIHIYLKKQVRLKLAGIEREMSIADLIGGHEEIIMHDEHGYRLSLQGKKITSLYGIKHLQASKQRDNVLNIAAIKHLDLRSNYILDHEYDPDFPERPFENFTGLQTLCLDENLLTCLPENLFAGLEHLSHLYLSNNQLTSLPEAIFQGLTHLDHLEISNNKLQRLPTNIFQGLHSLLWLGLNYNQLTAISEDTFQGLHKLYLLEIAHNQLTQLPEGVFQGLVKLEVLDLGHNKLTQLPENVFQSLPQLKNLDLIANNLTKLPETIFQVVNRFGSLRLGGNMLSEEQQNKICDFCIDRDCEISLS